MKQLSNRFGISIIFTIPVLIISMGPMVGMPLPNIVDPMINAFNFSLLQLILTLPIMVVSWEYFQKGFKTLFKGRPNMDSPDCAWYGVCICLQPCCDNQDRPGLRQLFRFTLL